jgi:hypothetical protein
MGLPSSVFEASAPHLDILLPQGATILAKDSSQPAADAQMQEASDRGDESESFDSDTGSIEEEKIPDVFNEAAFLGNYLPYEQCSSYSINPEWRSNYRLYVFALVRLHIFADKYLVNRLQNDIASALLRQCHAWFGGQIWTPN